ncbi:hypothetical protein LCGC14_2821240, partial [marine sediment metagenome]
AKSKPIATGIQGFLYDIRTSVIAFLFVINPELILFGVDTWGHGLLIFGMALIGMGAFECAAQGWCITKNRWYEIPFFLLASLALFHPGAIAPFIPIELPSKYFVFPLGIAIYLGVVIEQKLRMPPAPAPDEAG